MVKNKEKYLIIRKYGHIGDLLMMTPALEEFSKNKLIDIQIPSGYKEIFFNLDFINNIFGLDEKLDYKSYKQIINLSDFEFNYEQIHQPQIKKTKLELFADGLNVNIKRKRPIIKLKRDEILRGEEFVSKKQGEKIILIAPISTNASRNWSLNKWKELINILKKENYKIIIADKSLRWDDNDLIFLNNKNLRDLFAIVSQVDIIVTLDSALLHIGASFNIRTVVLFGPTDYKIRIYPNCYEIHKETGCSPCWYKRCKELHCLKLITIKDVYDKIKEASL